MEAAERLGDGEIGRNEGTRSDKQEEVPVGVGEGGAAAGWWSSLA